MLFISAEDFFMQAAKMPRLTRKDEKRLSQETVQNTVSREQLICSYFPMVADYILHRCPEYLHTLHTVYVFLDALEKSVDSFDFLLSREPFSHYLSRRLCQCIIRCIADR